MGSTLIISIPISICLHFHYPKVSLNLNCYLYSSAYIILPTFQEPIIFLIYLIYFNVMASVLDYLFFYFQIGLV